mmetsp:Transcript_7099/g.15002  ORF Transcript_7099/g.15002 Transcript_7099/m.15002 type:complete len:452 (+) Transcript_7099:40-1395(+)
MSQELSRPGGPSPAPSTGSRLANALAALLLASYALGHLYFRVAEHVVLARTYPRQAIGAAVGSASLLRAAPHASSQVRAVAVLAAVAVVSHLEDRVLLRPMPTPNRTHRGKVVVVTGANSGVGFELSRQLSMVYGANVVMACRSEERCGTAAAAIAGEIESSGSLRGGTVTPMRLDLSDLSSVEEFVDALGERRVDVLMNNAGFVPPPGMPPDANGLDPAFASMHVSHFYLAELLVRSNPALRVVNTSSGTHHICAVPFALPPSLFGLVKDRLPQRPGCLDEQYLETGIRTETDAAAYIQSKLANVMHASSFPARHPGSVAFSVDLGWVGTSIMPFMRGSVNPAGLGMMRTAEVGVRPLVIAALSPVYQLTSDLPPDSARSSRPDGGGAVVNVLGRAEDAFGYGWWRDGPVADLSRGRMLVLAERLWDVTEVILKERTRSCSSDGEVACKE